MSKEPTTLKSLEAFFNSPTYLAYQDAFRLAGTAVTAGFVIAGKPEAASFAAFGSTVGSNRSAGANPGQSISAIVGDIGAITAIAGAGSGKSALTAIGLTAAMGANVVTTFLSTRFRERQIQRSSKTSPTSLEDNGPLEVIPVPDTGPQL